MEVEVEVEGLRTGAASLQVKSREPSPEEELTHLRGARPAQMSASLLQLLL